MNIAQIESDFKKYYLRSQLTKSEDAAFSPLIAEIVHNKICAIQNNDETAWAKAVSVIQSAITDKQLFDENFLQFPSYQLHLLLKKESDQIAEKTTSIYLNLSLLTKSYTIYIEEKVTVHKLTAFDPVNSHVRFLRSYSATFDKAYSEINDTLTNAIATHFEDYTFIHHQVLMHRREFGFQAWPDKEDYVFNETSSWFELMFAGANALYNAVVLK